MTTFDRLVEVSSRVAARGRRLDKIDALASYLRQLEPAEVESAVAMLSGELPGGRIGVGYATLNEARPDEGAAESRLTVAEVTDTFDAIAKISGRGSAADKVARLRDLLRQATRPEQDFLFRLLVGELRQGALDGLMLEAVSRAAEVPATELRRAAMLAGDLREVAQTALTNGLAGLSRYRVELFRPLQPMLAQPAEGVHEALEGLEHAAFEYKIDGARVQVHRLGSEVRVYSRTLKDVTDSVPEVVEAARALPATEVILDGEAVAVRKDGSPLPFQTTMRRFGRKLDVESMRRELPLRVVLFDCLYHDGDSLIDRAGEERWQTLTELLTPDLAIPRLLTDSIDDAQQFLRTALAAGHEGVMAKALSAAYQAGSRGKSWLKIKPTHTLDLVVLAAEWGHGRRHGLLSNLHLGARDPAGGFAMLGKTFKGLTDQMLEWQTKRLLELEAMRRGNTVFVEPALVVEIAFNDVQASPHYPAGMALRFARVKGHRPDKTAAEADTLDTVRAIFEGQHR